MASEHGEEIIRKEHSKRGESRARRGAVGDCSRTFGATRFLLLYSFPDPSPAPSRNYSLHRYFHQSSRLVPRNHQKRINHCTNNCASRFYPTNLRKSSPRKIPKIRGDFKIGRRLGIEKCWYKLFLFEEGCPLNRHAHSSRLGPPEDGPRSIRGGGCCERGGRKRNGSCPVSRIAEWRVRATRLEVIRAICRRSSQVDRGRPGRDPALTSIRRPVARAHLTRINLETESRPRFTVQVQVQGSWNLHAPGLPSSLTLRRALSPTDFWSKAAEVAKSCYSCLEG